MVIGLNMKRNSTEINCEVCNKCKIHQLSYKSSTKKEKERLELIHSDICSPINVLSLGGARYFITFINDMSRYVEVVMLKTRSDVITAFRAYKKRAEKETGCQIKKIRTDTRRNTYSKNSATFLKKKG